jgi:hypothetical protein
MCVVMTIDLVGLHIERLQAFADRMNNFARVLAAASSKPVSHTKVPCGPLITQT